MCGIVGYVGPRDAVSVLVEGLSRLEYRGYDSAGVAVLNGGGVETRKLAGRIGGLRRARNGADLAPRGSCAPATVANPLSRCSIPRSVQRVGTARPQT